MKMTLRLFLANFCCYDYSANASEAVPKIKDTGVACQLTKTSDVNIRADFVGSFSACYQVGPRGRFSNLRFGATLTFRLTAGF